MKSQRTSKRLVFFLFLLIPLPGCQHIDALLHPVPPARTTPPPQTFDESASFGWRVWWGMSHDYLAPRSREMDKQGLRPQNLEVYNDEGDTTYACIYLRDPRAWQARWHYERPAFDREFRILRDKGYQPIDIEVVNELGVLRYSSLWIENPGGPAWVARWHLTHEEFLDEIDDYRRKGYRPIDLETYGFDGKTRYVYVMIHDPEKSDWEAVWGKTAEGMEAEFNRLVGRGYRMTNLEASYPQGELRLSGIFVKDSQPTEWRWTSSRSGGQIRQEIDALGDRFRPVHIAVAPHKEGGLVYIIIWRRN